MGWYIMKYSKQRELIYNALAENKIHPSADEIYNILKNDHPALSLATVYRNLNQLAENHEVLKVQIPGQKDRFDCDVHEHYHFVCEKCGKIFDIKKECLPMPKGCIVEGHRISSLDLSINGICKECASLEKDY